MSSFQLIRDQTNSGVSHTEIFLNLINPSKKKKKILIQPNSYHFEMYIPNNFLIYIHIKIKANYVMNII